MTGGERIKELTALVHDAAFRFIFIAKNLIRELESAEAEKQTVAKESKDSEFYRKEATLWRKRWEEMKKEFTAAVKTHEERDEYVDELETAAGDAANEIKRLKAKLARQGKR